MYIGVHFPTEIEPETSHESATASPDVKSGVSVENCDLIGVVMCVCHALQLDAKQKTKPRRIKSSTKEEDSKLAKIDKELDRQKTERRQNWERAASVREQAALVIEDVERLEQEKQDLVKEIEKKERELGYFKKLHGQRILENHREKRDLQESIQTKEKEIHEAKDKLKENEKKLEKYKEKVHSLKKRIEEGVRELEICDGSIIQLEKEKAKVVADLESERMKVRVHPYSPDGI